MQRQDFHYHLPEELIAETPAAERTASRLLVLDGASGGLKHSQFASIVERLAPGDLLVMNDTRVIPARLYGRKASGGQVEILVERVLDSQRVLAMVRASKSPKPGSQIVLADHTILEVEARQNAFTILHFPAGRTVLEVLDALGEVPLPPYIERKPEAEDSERYQTVYSREPGAVAAPTAGLHFDEALLTQLKQKGVEQAFVTLHVGAGTFQPVRVDKISEHAMHSEVMSVPESVCEQVRACKARGGRVVAVGTTSVRCLETAAASGEIHPYNGETEIFIYPSYQFKVVDVLITNFHLPESTLLMLVSAFAGYRETMAAYREAVEQRYRFFSYGDAMFIHRNPSPSLPESV